jgi:hypothetical protein
MATEIPYKWITGLPHEAQREIERNFLHVQGQIVAAGNGFDCTIDPAATSNNSSSHTYVNLAGVVAGESWNANRQLVIRMIGRPGTAVVDSGAITLPGPTVIVGMGDMGQYESSSTTAADTTRWTRPKWDLRVVIGLSSTAQLILRDIHVQTELAAGTITSYFGSGGAVFLHGCNIVGQDSTPTQRCNTVGGAVLFAYETNFYGCMPQSLGNGDVYCFDCSMTWGLNLTLSIAGSGEFVWDGGVFGVTASGNPALTFGGSKNYYFRSDAVVNSTSWGSSSSSPAQNCAVSITTSGSVYIDTAYVGWKTVTVNASPSSVYMKGVCGSLSVSANTGGAFSSQQIRWFDVCLLGQGVAPSADISGPGVYKLTTTTSIGTHQQIIVRGTGVRLDAEMGASDSPAVKLIGAIDTLATVVLGEAGGGIVPYNIDAASSRNILVISGTNHGYAAGVNAGANNRIITENGDFGLSVGVGSGGLIDFTQAFMLLG